jgi:O-antigen ligase/polysaccharide polymerase Wzy-like membrane protein
MTTTFEGAARQTSPTDVGPVAPPGRVRPMAQKLAVGMAGLAMVFQPILHPSGPGNSSPVDLFTAGTLLLTAMWAATSRRKLGAPYLLGAALMALGGTLGGLNGPLPGTALLSVAQDFVLIGWATALYNLAREPGVLRTLTRVYAWAAVCWAGLLVSGSLAGINAIEGTVPREGNRELFTFGDPNYAAAYWVVSLFIVFATKTPRNPWLRWVGYVLLIWCLVLTESNGGVLELLVGVVFIVLYTVCRRRGLVAGLALLLVIGGGVAGMLVLFPFNQLQAWALQSHQSYLVNSLGRSNGSSGQRGTLLAETIRMYATDGILGSGPMTTKQLLYDRQYPYAKEAHDDYVAALVERGPLGVLGLIIVVLSAGWKVGRVLRAPPKSGFLTQVPRPVGMVAALLVMGMAGAYYEVWHFRFVWILLAFIAVLASKPDSPEVRP